MAAFMLLTQGFVHCSGYRPLWEKIESDPDRISGEKRKIKAWRKVFGFAPGR